MTKTYTEIVSHQPILTITIIDSHIQEAASEGDPFQVNGAHMLGHTDQGVEETGMETCQEDTIQDLGLLTTDKWKLLSCIFALTTKLKRLHFHRSLQLFLLGSTIQFILQRALQAKLCEFSGHNRGLRCESGTLHGATHKWAH